MFRPLALFSAPVSRASAILRTAGLSAALALTACVAQPPGPRQPALLNGAIPSQAVALPGPGGSGPRVAILLPLTGPAAELGQAMLKAAQLSMSQPGSPTLDPQDTGGTADGAAAAARTALAAGANLILGPLTAGETAAAGAVSRAANVPMLAFTSDATQAQPGVWTLGITPTQQVRRLLLAVQAENKTRIAAVLPRNVFGDALASSLLTVSTSAGLPPPRIVRAANGFAGLTAAMKDVSDSANRRDPADTAAAPKPPPMDALFLGTVGDTLGQVVPMLGFYDVAPTQVRVLGPATWARDAARQPNLAGAWYAAPDPAGRAAFEQAYLARYGVPARDLTNLAYDAAGIARVTATVTAAGAGFPLESLTRAEGFAGVDGPLALQPDGQVRRGLAIFEVDRNGAHIVQPAPASLGAPGS